MTPKTNLSLCDDVFQDGGVTYIRLLGALFRVSSCPYRRATNGEDSFEGEITFSAFCGYDVENSADGTDE